MSKEEYIDPTELVVRRNKEDFSQWNWGPEYPDPRNAAAAMVLKELVEQGHLEFDNRDGFTTALFSSLDGNLVLECSLIGMMKYWIATRGRDAEIPDNDTEDSLILLRDLKNIIAILEDAMP